MATCASCGEWMSALVYACPHCGAKPKGPPPRGLVISDTLPSLGLDEGEPRKGTRPRRSGEEPQAAAGRPARSEPFSKAPGPAPGAGPKPLPDAETPKPAVRRPPAPSARPAPRRPAPSRKEPPPSSDEPVLDDDDDDLT